MPAEKGYDLAGRKLFVALPAYDFKISVKLAVSLTKFAHECGKHGISLAIGSICGCSVVSRARNLLAKDFLESECTDLLFIDSDINFEPEAIYRLLAWTSDEKKGIVAAAPRVRDTDCRYIAKLDQDEHNQVTMNGMGLVKMKRVATAFMMVRREVFETLVKAHPEWEYYDERSKRTLSCIFDFQLMEEGYVGEDFLFCDRVREQGFEVWVDPTIELGHMGVQEYVGSFGKDILYPMLTPEKEVA